MVYILARKPRQKLDYFLIGSLIGGAFEYLISFLQGGLYRNNIMGLFNISIKYKWQNNFTNICYSGVYYVIYSWLKYIPLYQSKIEKIPYNLGNLIYYILLVVITIDMFYIILVHV